MKFTYDAYRNLLDLLKRQGYECASYHDWQSCSRPVILRHDIDEDIFRALKFAELEKEADWKSIYFVLLKSDAYNPLSPKHVEMLKCIMEYGHEIGLHFDEMCYPEAIGDVDVIRKKILEEASVLGGIVGVPVKCVSMHRPSKAILEANLEIPDIVNSYGQTFFHTFKYISDSRRHWREPIEEIVKGGKYDRLHILTHAFWYRDEEQDIRMTLEAFINDANSERYEVLRDNITNLDEILSEEYVKESAQANHRYLQERCPTL